MYQCEIYGIFLYLKMKKKNKNKQAQKLQSSVFDCDIPTSHVI